MKKICIWLTSLLLGSASVQADVRARFASEAGDYIGAGQTWELNDSVDPVQVTADNNHVRLWWNGTSTWWDMDFHAPESLDPGPYFDATRYPFQGPLEPGLSVSGDGRGCNQLHGYFVVYELERNGSSLEKLALDYVQYCDNSVGALRGSVRINSTLPMPANLPVAWAGADFSVDESTQVTLDGNRSLGSGLTYLWQQEGGPTVALTGSTNSTRQFAAPTDVDLGGTNLEFKLTVTDGSNNVSEDYVTVKVRSKSDPVTRVHFTGDHDDYISGGNTWHYTPENATISAQKNFSNGVSINVNGSSWWNLEFAPAGNAALIVGNYNNAIRFPFNDNSNGLNVSGDGRGCNALTGHFDVSQIVKAGDSVERFAATYEQHCEGGVAALRGEVLFNAIPDGVPNADAGADQAIHERQTATLNGSGSFDGDGSISEYTWSQVSGPTVTLSNRFDIRPSFVAPALGNRQTGATLGFRLLVKDNDGYKAQDFVSVSVTAQNEAPNAGNDSFTLIENTATPLAVLSNDSDSDGTLNAASIELVIAPAHGDVVIQSNGSLVYTPDTDYVGSDSLHYVVFDNDGASSAEAIVQLTIEQAASSGSNDSGGGGGSPSLLLLAILFGANRCRIRFRKR